MKIYQRQLEECYRKLEQAGNKSENEGIASELGKSD